MSLHLTLAKKVLGNAKDLLKFIFNEAGQDVKAMERKFLEALKDHAHDELQKAEANVSGSLQSGLQQWQKAPRPEDATSVHAPADLSYDDKESEDEDEAPKADAPADPTASDETSETADESKTGGDDTSGTDTDGKTEPATFECSEPHAYGDADQAEYTTPARIAPVDPSELPTEGAASVHGDALPSSAIDSQAMADSGKSDFAGSELDLPDATKASDAAVDAQVASAPEPAPVEEKPAEISGGQDETVAEETKAEQEDVPALNGGLDAQKDEGKTAEPSAEPSDASAQKVESADKSE